MDKIDKLLLNRIQKEFPIHRTPFKILGELFSIDESEVISRIKVLKEQDQIIRTISPIFEGSKLGYHSALIALKVDIDNLAKIAEKINTMPGVSHNYRRDCEYNIWFTLAIKTDQNIDNCISSFCKENNIEKYLILPPIKTFKLNTSFNLSEIDRVSISGSSKCCQKCNDYKIDDIDRKVIKELQVDLPIVSQPFEELAKNAGIEISEFVNRAEMLLAHGIIRRFCATIRHTNTGINYNALVVWSVDEDLIEVAGKIASAESFVSHCYHRKSCPEWPYNFYTMIHANTENQLYSYIDKLDIVVNSSAKKVLKTLEEFKKTRTMYLV